MGVDTLIPGSWVWGGSVLLVTRKSKFREEFKRDAVALVADSGRSVNHVARELGLNAETLRVWVRKARMDEDPEAGVEPGVVRPSEAAKDVELSELRKRVAELEEEREILRTAAAYFAKEMGR